MTIRRSKSLCEFDDEIGSIVQTQLEGSQMFADDDDTVIGGESLYCTQNDEIAKGHDL